MKIAGLARTKIMVLTLAVSVTAHADFSYTMMQKGAQGPMAAMAGPQSTRHFFKGQKMKIDTGGAATILDFEAQTVILINNAQKTYSVSGFGDLGKVIPQGADPKIDLRETGQKKTINGFNASQVIMTMEMDGGGGPPGMKMQMEMELWISPDVPGAQEVKAFYAKNAAQFPWAAIGGGGNPAMQKTMSDIQKRMASLGGIAVQQIVRMKPAGGSPQAAQAEQAAQGGRAQAMAQLEAMRKQGGPQAAAAEAALARTGGGAGGGGGSMFEITMEATDFSTGTLADSVFLAPAGYQKK